MKHLVAHLALRPRPIIVIVGTLFAALALPLAFAGAASTTAPTPVLLGTAAPFAVLAGSGITNTGASTIVGDVGSSPTHSETGFAGCPAADCVALTGANHNDPDPNDAATQSAKSALTTAYDNAAGQTPTLVATELAGQTLVAGVYNSASGTFGMTGTLVLDGEDNPDATFIFQTASTLITGGTANVSLIRGAQACNVFWKIGSAATLGGGSTFRGTIMAHDSISLGGSVTVDGRLLAGEQASGTGAVSLINDTIKRPTTCVTAADVAAAAAVQAAAAAAAQAQAAAAAAATAAQAAAATAAQVQATAVAAQAQAAAKAAAAQAVIDAKTAADAAAKAASDAKAAADAAAKAASAAKAAADTAAAAAAAKNAAAAKRAAAVARHAAAVATAKAKAARILFAKVKAAAKVTAAAKAKIARAARSHSKSGLAHRPIRHVGLTG